MNILHIASSWKGGVIRVVFDLSKELSRKGHNIRIYGTQLINENLDLGNSISNKVVKFYTVSPQLAKKTKLYVTPGLIHQAKDIKYFDVVHLHGYVTFQNLVVYHYARKYKVPYILQAHGSLPITGSWKKLKRLYDILFGHGLLRNASKVIALSEVEAEQYKRMGVPEEKIAIIPNGIDLSEYADLPPKGFFKKKFNIPEDKKIILYLGRIHKTKGIDFLVKAYAYLIKKVKYKDAVLVIAGPDDGYLNEVKSLVHDLGVSDSVLYTDFLPEGDKIRAYVDSDVVVNVEPLNVYGLVPLEAAACSTPVIVSKTNAISKMVADGKFGYSVKYRDVTSLAFTLQKILGNEELAENLGRNGRRYVFNHLDWNEIIKKYEQVYKEAISIMHAHFHRSAH